MGSPPPCSSLQRPKCISESRRALTIDTNGLRSRVLAGSVWLSQSRRKIANFRVDVGKGRRGVCDRWTQILLKSAMLHLDIPQKPMTIVTMLGCMMAVSVAGLAGGPAVNHNPGGNSPSGGLTTLGRWIGCGYGDGYHSCESRGFQFGDNLPIGSTNGLCGGCGGCGESNCCGSGCGSARCDGGACDNGGCDGQIASHHRQRFRSCFRGGACGQVLGCGGGQVVQCAPPLAGCLNGHRIRATEGCDAVSCDVGGCDNNYRSGREYYGTDQFSETQPAPQMDLKSNASPLGYSRLQRGQSDADQSQNEFQTELDRWQQSIPHQTGNVNAVSENAFPDESTQLNAPIRPSVAKRRVRRLNSRAGQPLPRRLPAM